MGLLVTQRGQEMTMKRDQIKSVREISKEEFNWYTVDGTPEEYNQFVRFSSGWAPCKEIFDVVNDKFVRLNEEMGVSLPSGNAGSAAVLATKQGVQNLVDRFGLIS